MSITYSASGVVPYTSVSLSGQIVTDPLGLGLNALQQRGDYNGICNILNKSPFIVFNTQQVPIAQAQLYCNTNVNSSGIPIWVGIKQQENSGNKNIAAAALMFDLVLQPDYSSFSTINAVYNSFMAYLMNNGNFSIQDGINLSNLALASGSLANGIWGMNTIVQVQDIINAFGG